MADSLLFVDPENIVISLRNLLGRQFVAREVIDAAGGWDRLHDAVAYADFSRVPDAIARCLGRAGFTSRNVPRIGGKDVVDHAVTIDILETALTRSDVHRIVLAAGDGDYVPVLSRARQLGKDVLVLAVRGALSGELRETVESNIAFLEGGAELHHAQQTPLSSPCAIRARGQVVRSAASKVGT